MLIKIDRRLGDIDSFDVDRIEERDNPEVDGLSSKLDALLLSIFGVDTVEYNRYKHIKHLDTASRSTYGHLSIPEIQEGGPGSG